MDLLGLGVTGLCFALALYDIIYGRHFLRFGFFLLGLFLRFLLGFILLFLVLPTKFHQPCKVYDGKTKGKQQHRAKDAKRRVCGKYIVDR